MNNINHDIFRAIHEGKWLKIEYKNRELVNRVPVFAMSKFEIFCG